MKHIFFFCIFCLFIAGCTSHINQQIAGDGDQSVPDDIQLTPQERALIEELLSGE